MTIEKSIMQASAALHQSIDAAVAVAKEQIHLHASLAKAELKRMAEYPIRSAGARQGWETRRGKEK